MLQLTELRPQRVLLALLQSRGVELAHLKAQKILALDTVPLGRPQPVSLLPRRPVLGMQGADSPGRLLRVGEAVEQLELTQGLEQSLVLVLAVDFDQRFAEPLEQAHRDRRVIDERPVSSRA